MVEKGSEEPLSMDYEDTSTHFTDDAESPPARPELDRDFESYIRLVESRCVGFIRISQAVYVVQGWNVKERMATDHWYHMQVQHTGDDISLACMCPQGGFADKPCVHTQFYMEFRDERFREDEDLPFREGKTVVFWRERIGFEEELWLTRFSVRGHSEALTSRAVVTYEGLDDGFGSWHCSKDKNTPCSHIPTARKFFGQIFGQEHETNDSNSAPNSENSREVDDEDYVVDDGAGLEPAISHLPIMPLPWAMLSTDIAHYIRPPVEMNYPVVIAIAGRICGSLCRHEAVYDPTRAVTVKECTIYTLTGTRTTKIELQQCANCPSRRHCYIGPDTRDLGLFNFNNSVLFAHELLDEYTSRYTSSVTPFSAFIQAMSRVYECRGNRFVKEDLFRSVWFAYASVQDLRGDMFCNRCGSTPENVIWDGMTLSFSKKHLNNMMKPPTVETEDSTVRLRKYRKEIAWMPMKSKELASFRRRVLAWLRKGKKAQTQQDEDESEEEHPIAPAGNYYGELLSIAATFTKVTPSLGTMFLRVFGTELSSTGALDKSLRKWYSVFFEQLVAEEPAVQMVNEAAMENLNAFIEHPSRRNASALVDIPALMRIAEKELQRSERCPSDLLDVCRWMHTRLSTVLCELKSGDLPLLPLLQRQHGDANEWKMVSTAKN
ncbi:hypothetical protein VNI00_017766 [Paramarasmius palmivorus]|uniref:SWIM-type domain-containing protein n=1 Tax=Paramarasmius palmivorus TaxID=297713 RepID=A0AAW0B4E7_9AGAR